MNGKQTVYKKMQAIIGKKEERKFVESYNSAMMTEVLMIMICCQYQ